MAAAQGRIDAAMAAIEAAEQSDRLSVPAVTEAVPLLDVLARWPASRRLYFLDETGGGVPIGDAFDDRAPASFLTGPEGRDVLRSRGFRLPSN